MPPFFSIAIPVYNMRETVQASVESVIGQTFPDWHLDIIDDQSTDGTWELVTSLYAEHPKITLRRNSRNLGQRGNLDHCLRVATGEWLGFLPADDTYRLHVLETIAANVRNEPQVILWTHAHFVHGAGIVPNIVPVFPARKVWESTKAAELLYLKGNLFGELSSYFCRRAAVPVTENNLFIDGEASLDMRFWIRFLRHNPHRTMIYWPDVLASVLLHDFSGSSHATKSGRVYGETLETPSALVALGWPRRVLLYQLARMVWVYLRFRNRLQDRRLSTLLQNAFPLLGSLAKG